jgi:hypothetical protein
MISGSYERERSLPGTFEGNAISLELKALKAVEQLKCFLANLYVLIYCK